jgi:hypothetical protein
VSFSAPQRLVDRALRQLDAGRTAARANLASEMTPGATAVKLSDTEQTPGGGGTIGGTAVTSVVVVNATTITATAAAGNKLLFPKRLHRIPRAWL